VLEHRALRPHADITPNGNTAEDNPPASVGADVFAAGDALGFEVVSDGTYCPTRTTIVPSAWDGWPDEWPTPMWGHVEDLTDIAWAAVDLNASVLASMPAYLVGAARGLPHDWLGNPSPDLYASWDEFAKQLVWDYHTGEVFVLATAYYSNGYPARFHVVSPPLVNVEIVDGIRRYNIGSLDVTGDMLHIRYAGKTDDAHGHGPLEAGRARLVAARMLTRYSTNLATSGAIPPGALVHPDTLTAEQATDLQNRWLAARMSSMGLPAVLSGGVTYESLGQVSPRDLALIELLQFNDSRVAVLLGVPPFLLGLPSGGDSMTYSNVTSLFDYHWRASLRPKASAIMSALSGWLLPRGTRLELNRDEYVQPGPLERAQTAQILHGIEDDGGRAMTVAEIRAGERLGEATTTAELTEGLMR
jgi:HK97 family phage portal protein